MSDRITCEEILLKPSEGRPMDDQAYPGFVHTTRVGPGRVRVEIIGTSHRLDDRPEASAWELMGDRPYVEVELSSEAARRLAMSLLGETERATAPGLAATRRRSDGKPN